MICSTTEMGRLRPNIDIYKKNDGCQITFKSEASVCHPNNIQVHWDGYVPSLAETLNRPSENQS